MTANHECVLTCDGPGCEQTYPAEGVDISATNLRQDARETGWACSSGGRDLCPSCRHTRPR